MLVPAGGGPLYLTDADDRLRLAFDEAGLNAIQRDVGTGYHQPEGILVRYGAGIQADAARRKIETTEIAPMIMTDLGIALDSGTVSSPPAYAAHAEATAL